MSSSSTGRGTPPEVRPASAVEDDRRERDQYRREVLAGQFEAVQHDADALFGLVSQAMAEAFIEEAVRFALHLHTIDPDRERATVMLAIAECERGKPAEARQLLEAYRDAHGATPSILTNLAKAQAAQGDRREAEATLWQSLELDPNQPLAFNWWLALGQEAGGDTLNTMMRRLAAVPGAWRATLWLARRVLETASVHVALPLYRSAAASGPQLDGGALVQISGDLGKAGMIDEAYRLVAPLYDPRRHGTAAGLNLVVTCIALGFRSAGLRLLDQVAALTGAQPDPYQTTLRDRLTAMTGDREPPTLP